MSTYKAVHSVDNELFLDIPTLGINNWYLGYIQRLDLTTTTKTEPYHSIGARNLMPTDFFRHSTLAAGTFTHAVIHYGSLYNILGLSLLLSPEDLSLIENLGISNAITNLPYVPRDQTTLKLLSKRTNKGFEFANFTAYESKFVQEQGKFSFETISFYTNVVREIYVTPPAQTGGGIYAYSRR